MNTQIKKRFGTWRGLVRLALGYAEWMAGRLRAFGTDYKGHPGRIIFVCQGNICRSAFAEKFASQLGLPATSVGLWAVTGTSPPAEAIAAAARLGVDLSSHQALAWEDFHLQTGDFFLVMEIRQAHELRRRLGGRTDVHIAILGLWCQPIMPHLHDPFTLCDAYFEVCLKRIGNAVACLRKAPFLGTLIKSGVPQHEVIQELQ